MKLLLFEGVATTGKSTVENLLQDLLVINQLSCNLYHEDQTVIPLLGDKSIAASRQLQEQLTTQFEHDDHDVVLVDRFYLTHLERTEASPSDFAEIHQRLQKLGVHIIFFIIDEDQFRPRLLNAISRRAQKFADHITSKGGVDVVVQKYIDQQRTLIKLLETTDLPVSIYNTTQMEFSHAANDILQHLILKEKSSDKIGA